MGKTLLAYICALKKYDREGQRNIKYKKKIDLGMLLAWR